MKNGYVDHLVWQGGWGTRISQLLFAKGFTSATEFARAFPCRTVFELAGELGLQHIAPIQLIWIFADEARAEGRLELHAQDMLVRYLHELPEGWPTAAEDNERARDDAADVLTAWQGCLHGRHAGELEAMSCALLEDTSIPRGWMPISSADPIILDVFHKFWAKLLQ